MKKINLMYLFFALLTFSACSDDDNEGGAWAIPEELVFDGGPGKDGIPSIDSPIFTSISNTNFLTDNDLVIVARWLDSSKVGEFVRKVVESVN